MVPVAFVGKDRLISNPFPAGWFNLSLFWNYSNISNGFVKLKVNPAKCLINGVPPRAACHGRGSKL
jgi:hypothetical protein